METFALGIGLKQPFGLHKTMLGRGLEPPRENHQPVINKGLTESTNSNLCASLCNPLQEDTKNTVISPTENPSAIEPELQQIDKVWSHMPEELIPELAGLLQLWPRLPDKARAEIKRIIAVALPENETDKMPPPKIVYDFGYQYRTFEDVVKLIKHFKITTLCDIRTSPYSRKADFNREMLQKLPCKYLWRGQTLGGLRGEKLDEWTQGLAEIAQLAATEKIALMCMEYAVTACHRQVLMEILRQRYGVFAIHL